MITVPRGTVANISGNTAVFGYWPDAVTVTVTAPEKHEYRWSISDGTAVMTDTAVSIDVYVEVILR